MIPHQGAQYLFDLVPVDLVVSLDGNSPMEKQREWRVAVFPTPVSGVGCHFFLFFLVAAFFFLPMVLSCINSNSTSHFNFQYHLVLVKTNYKSAIH